MTDNVALIEVPSPDTAAVDADLDEFRSDLTGMRTAVDGSVRGDVDQSTRPTGEKLQLQANLGREIEVASFAALAEIPIIVQSARTREYIAGSGRGGARYSWRANNPGLSPLVQQPALWGGWLVLDEAALRPEMVDFRENDAAAGAQNDLAWRALLDAMAYLRRPIRGKAGVAHHINSPQAVTGDYCDIGADGQGRFLLKCASPSGVVLSLQPANGALPAVTVPLTANARFGSKIITVSSTALMLMGDIIRMVSNKASPNDPREAAGWVEADANAAAAQGGTSDTITLRATHTTPASVVINSSVTIRRGTGAGQTRKIIAFDPVSKVATVDRPWQTPPDATSIYQVPQGTKGQTTRLRRIISATQIETEDSLLDGYHVVDTVAEGFAKEEVLVEVYRPFTPSIRIAIEGPGGDQEAHGLSVFAGNNAEIDVRCSWTNRSGVRLTNSYACDVRVEPDASNDRETGYGLQISNSARTRVNAKGWASRRVVDVSGTTPSDFTVIRNIIAVGGGLQEDGQAYAPLGPISNTGVGAHGLARFTTYEDCVFSDLYYGIYERGWGFTAKRCLFGPNLLVPIYVSFGGPVHIEDCFQDPREYENATGVSLYLETAAFGEADRQAYPDHFLTVGANFDGIRTAGAEIVSASTVKGNKVAVRKSLIGVEHTLGVAKAIKNMLVTDNVIDFLPVSATDELALIAKTANSGTGALVIHDRCFFARNVMRTNDNNKRPLLYAGVNVALSSSAGVIHPLGEGRYRVRLATGTRASFPVSQAKDINSLRVFAADDQIGTGHFFDGLVRRDSADTNVISNRSGTFELSATKDGGASPNIALHYGSGELTLTNRTTLTRTFIVYIDSLG